MMKRLVFLSASVFVLAMLVQPTVHAQSTEQTDQSEEDWRRSQKKSSSDRSDPTRALPGLGGGIPLPPLEPIDSLPQDSRRHLQRQRAKVIAEVEFGETPGDVPYEPSEEAKTDPELAAEEEAVWELILTDLQGGSGGGAPAESGPNNVAVAGRGGGSSGSLTRGGSSQSAADILAQLKGLQSSGGPSGGGQDAPSPQSTQAGGAAQSAGAGQAGEQPQGEAGEGDAAQQGEGQEQGEGAEGGGEGTQEGEGDAPTGEGEQGEGEDGQDSGEGAEDGSEGEGAEEGDAGEEGAESSTSTPQPPPGPLDVIRSQGPLAPESGTRSSASDFLRGQGTSTVPDAPETPPAEN